MNNKIVDNREIMYKYSIRNMLLITTASKVQVAKAMDFVRTLNVSDSKKNEVLVNILTQAGFKATLKDNINETFNW